VRGVELKPHLNTAIQGFIFGCIFWMKFSLVGIYLVLVILVFFTELNRRGLRRAIGLLILFGFGALAATLPWIIYFGLNHAIKDWLTAYLYNNVFLYSNPEHISGLLAKIAQILDSIRLDALGNLWYAVPVAFGLASLIFKRSIRPLEKVSIIACFAVQTLGVYAGGRAYAYYCLVLAAYIPFAAVAVNGLFERFELQKWSKLIATILTVIICAVFAFFNSYNTYFFAKSKANFPQFKFAEIITSHNNQTLLNYGFMDEAFYTVSGIIPTVKYFGTLNILENEIANYQEVYLLSGETEFVVTKDNELDLSRFTKYKLIAKERFNSKSYYSDFYLYMKK
jgi:hypothetical protein